MDRDMLDNLDAGVSTEEGSEPGGETPDSSESGSPALPLLPDAEHMEPLELPTAEVDMPNSFQEALVSSTAGRNIPPPPPVPPPALQMQDMQEADQESGPYIQSKSSPTEAASESTEIEDEWVVVTPPGADSLRHGALDCIDGQHPRHLFVKKPLTKQPASRQNAQDRAWAIDWSEEGIPQQVSTQLIKGSMDASHRSVYAKHQLLSPSLDELRAQKVAKQHRQASMSPSRSRSLSAPRSQSKSRVIKQPSGRR
jgi:hypothetical protein